MHKILTHKQACTCQLKTPSASAKSRLGLQRLSFHLPSSASFIRDLGAQVGFKYTVPNMKLPHLLLICLIAFLTGCATSDDDKKITLRSQKAEFIYRKQQEELFVINAPEIKVSPKYSWDAKNVGKYPTITKEFFRCRGSNLNPTHFVQKNGEPQGYHDCGGPQKHSLPLRDGKEFIYPILIDLLNHIQTTTGKQVVITSGHRCIEHNAYVDDTDENQYSKHMIGAEVSFYVLGMEEQPEAVISELMKFYQTASRYQGQKDYLEFKRYEKNDTNVQTPPWFNKEVFIKLFRAKEGRNFDNRHSYPYVSIQVRHDRDLNEKVIYSWEKAYKNYHRW